MYQVAQLGTKNIRMPSESDTFSACIFYPGTAEAILAQPDFTKSALKPLPTTKAYVIRDTPGMGKGMFATASFQPGDIIMHERPLVIMPTREVGLCGPDGKPITPWPTLTQETMTEDMRRAFYDLHNCHKGKPGFEDRIEFGICNTNNLTIDSLPGQYTGAYGAVCKDLSRVNHSCMPNANPTWDFESFSFRLDVTMPIQKGDQVFISYTDQLFANRSVRQRELEKYGFTCACTICSLSPTQARAYEKHLAEFLQSSL